MVFTISFFFFFLIPSDGSISILSHLQVVLSLDS